MRILRGSDQGRNVTLFLLLVLAAASSLTLVTSRPTHAESPSLLGTVRCVVRTVLSTECAKTEPATPAEQASPQANGSSASPTQTSRQDQSTAAEAKSPVTAPRAMINGDVTAPDQTLASYQRIDDVAPAHETGYAIDDSNYLTYFNSYSPYARAAQQDTVPYAVVEASPEGWRVLGIAWYWWLVILTCGVGVWKFVAIRQAATM